MEFTNFFLFGSEVWVCKTGAQGPQGAVGPAGPNVAAGNQIYAYATDEDVPIAIDGTDTTLIFDTLGAGSTTGLLGLGNGFYTVPTGMSGQYQITVNLNLRTTAGTAATLTVSQVNLRVTTSVGTTALSGLSTSFRNVITAGGAVGTGDIFYDDVTVSGIINLTAGDIIRVLVNGDDTENATLAYGAFDVAGDTITGTNLSIHRILAT